MSAEEIRKTINFLENISSTTDIRSKEIEYSRILNKLLADIFPEEEVTNIGIWAAVEYLTKFNKFECRIGCRLGYFSWKVYMHFLPGISSQDPWEQDLSKVREKLAIYINNSTTVLKLDGPSPSGKTVEVPSRSDPKSIMGMYYGMTIN
jgi:hypothetical protein